MEQFFIKEQEVFKSLPEQIPTRDRLFGDGIFETMVFVNNEIRFEKDHQERALQGMEALKINPEKISKLTTITTWLKQEFKDHAKLRIRWNIFRAGTGKYTPPTKEGNESLIIAPYTLPVGKKEKAYISQSIFVPPSPWANCKTLNGLTYVMANIEREDKAMDEVILTATNGTISEAGSANIFWVKNGEFFTPSLESSCIAGIARKQIIHRLKERHLPLSIGNFYPEDLLNADQVFTSNVTGISHIRQINEHLFQTKPIPEIESLFSE